MRAFILCIFAIALADIHLDITQSMSFFDGFVNGCICPCNFTGTGVNHGLGFSNGQFFKYESLVQYDLGAYGLQSGQTVSNFYLNWTVIQGELAPVNANYSIYRTVLWSIERWCEPDVVGLEILGTLGSSGVRLLQDVTTDVQNALNEGNLTISFRIRPDLHYGYEGAMFYDRLNTVASGLHPVLSGTVVGVNSVSTTQAVTTEALSTRAVTTSAVTTQCNGRHC
jgi:hypothetical protein